jgi:signal peptidase I
MPVKLDFALILTVLSAFTGIVWLIDALFFARSRRMMVRDGEEMEEPVLVDYSRSLFPVLLLVLLLRSFLAEPFRIPSESMMPNLLVGDFILVNKFDYGLRLPVANTKVFANGLPKRGDVVVFRYPGAYEGDPEKGADYIKRIIGLPGDTVEVVEDKVRINGEPVAYRPAGVFVGTGAGLDNTGADIVEELLPGRPHTVLDEPGSQFPPSTWVVPAGQYFAMGDNRDHSADSRQWGFFPERNLVGRAMMIWLNCEGWFCSDGFDYSRIGDTIR